MYILVTYDIETMDAAGRSRLRRVAKVCQNYGQRVQNSVFECKVDATQYKMLELALAEIIDEDRDSLRFYNLGNSKSKAKHIGVKPSYDLEEAIII